jgi:hypothetical protein
VCGDWETASLSDLRLFRKAIKEDWSVPPERREPLLAAALSPLSNNDKPPRQAIALVWLMLTVEKHNQKLDWAELKAAQRKVTVEECFALAADGWESMPPSGIWRWPDRDGAVEYAFDSTRLVLGLHYSVANPSRQEPESVALSVQLRTHRTRFGGSRWWFICPLIRYGIACNRRVGNLYLPPNRRYFGCRHCHGLTYRSCQQS